MEIPKSKNKRVVIIGGGFAGIELIKGLQDKSFQVVLLDRNNFFTFQPLLYQVAMSGLEANSVAYPLRRLFRGMKNFFFRVAEVENIDTQNQLIETTIGNLEYDYLVIATGSRPKFFGLEQEQLLTLKSLPNALNMRNEILAQFERALRKKENGALNIVIGGGGPTGVELAGALGEMKKHVLPKDYPELDASRMKIFLIEGEERVLSNMSNEASSAAEKYLEELEVDIISGSFIKSYDGEKVSFGEEEIFTENLIWTAGVEAASLPGLEDVQDEKSPRILVNQYSQVLSYRNVFAIGDVAKMSTDEYPEGHPMLAPVAMQQGSFLAKNLTRMEQGAEPEKFEYLDKGTMATIGRNRAVVDAPWFKLQGFSAWFAWMFVHLVSLVGFRNKIVTLVNWIYNYFTYDRSLRLIIRTDEDVPKEKVQP